MSCHRHEKLLRVASSEDETGEETGGTNTASRVISSSVMETSGLVPRRIEDRCHAYWQMCVSRTDDVFSGASPAGHLPPPHTPFLLSILLIHNQADSSEWGCMDADGAGGGEGEKTPLLEWLVTSNLRLEVMATCTRGGPSRRRP